jgi:hypothetical protein
MAQAITICRLGIVTPTLAVPIREGAISPLGCGQVRLGYEECQFGGVFAMSVSNGEVEFLLYWVTTGSHFVRS